MSDQESSTLATPWRSWQAPSFDPPPPAPPVKVNLPTLDQVAAIEKSAHDQGYREGIEAARAELATLARINAAMSETLGTLEGDLAESVLALSLRLAQKMVGSALAMRPELLLPIVREALAAVPGVSSENVLYLHPRDIKMVEAHLADELERGGWRVAADERIFAGGCRVETAKGALDATLETRWQQLLAPLGHDDAWLG